MVKVWKARESTIEVVASSSITIHGNSPLHEIFSNAGSTSFQANCKNITITEPEGDVEQINLLGVDANSFQNAEKHETPYGMAEITGTVVHDGDELFEPFIGGSTSIGGTWTRWQFGEGSRSDASFLVELYDGGGDQAGVGTRVNICLDNATITSIGDRRISDAEGHWEQDFTAKCLPKDYYVEIQD